MKKQTKNLSLLLTIATIVAILLSACCKDDHYCKDDTLAQREVPVTDKIKGVIIEGAWEVAITQADTDNSAVLEYCASLEKKIKAELLPNGYLHIKTSGNIKGRHTFRANIKAAALEKIDASGAVIIRTYGQFGSLSTISLSGASKIDGLSCEGGTAKLTLSGASTLKDFIFNGNSIDANLSGASKATLDEVNIEQCKVDCSGSSTFDGSGYAAKTIFTGSGASNFKTLHLESENLGIELSGGSSAEVTVNKSIKGRLTGASTLRYRKATNVNVDTEGGSKIIRID